MKVYFVRHGESHDSVADFHQRPDSPLTEEGIRQASLVAKRFINIKIDTIISSPFTRAKQTAEVIGKTIAKPVYESILFREGKRPTEIEGKNRNSPEVVKIRGEIFKNWNKPDFRYSDEETFFDLRTRGAEAIKYLEGLNKESVLVVTHGIIAITVLALITFGKKLTSKELLSMSGIFSIGKAGITLFEYSSKSGWKLVTWNDQAHLD